MHYEVGEGRLIYTTRLTFLLSHAVLGLSRTGQGGDAEVRLLHSYFVVGKEEENEKERPRKKERREKERQRKTERGR